MIDLTTLAMVSSVSGTGGGSTEGLADLIQRVETLETFKSSATSEHSALSGRITALESKPDVTDAHINGLIDAKLSPVETALSALADRAEEVSG